MRGERDRPAPGAPAGGPQGDAGSGRDGGGDLLVSDGRPAVVAWLLAERRRWGGALLALAVLAVPALIARTSSPPRPHPRPPAPPALGPLRATPGPALHLGRGHPLDLALTNGVLFALYDSPPRLVRVATSQQTIAGAVAVPAGGRRLAYDGASVWVIGTEPPGSRVSAYDQNYLRRVSVATLPFAVSAAIASAGRLWLGGPDGLYALRPRKSPTRLLAGAVGALAADPARDRVLVARPAGSSTELVAVSTDSDRVTLRVSLPLRNVTLAATVDDVWVAGSGPAPRLQHLSEATLLAYPGERVPTGAVSVWAGQSMIWAKGPGEAAGLTCIDAESGDIRARWAALDGPVVSAPIAAYAVDDNEVVPLPISRACFPG